MQIEELAELVAMHPEAEAASKELGKSNGRHLWLSGLYASARSMLLNAIQQKTARPMVVVTDNADEAQYMYSDLQAMHNAQCTMHNDRYVSRGDYGKRAGTASIGAEHAVSENGTGDTGEPAGGATDRTRFRAGGFCL